ncbi:hypothetical protein F4774DRAFT_401854 [Daldinia eschscholtzii]|nr:hypothetical protein F4774DRAFT_401854 [Daldinia eschscholtzii]
MCSLGINGSSYTYISTYGPLASEAEGCISVFRSQVQKDSAFVYIFPNKTAQKLRQSRPFLLREIIAVSSPSMQLRTQRGMELKRVLAQAALIENQSNLDLLFGLSYTYLIASIRSSIDREHCLDS